MKHFSRSLAACVAASTMLAAPLAYADFAVAYRNSAGGSYTYCFDNQSCDLSGTNLQILKLNLDADWTSEISAGTSNNSAVPVSVSLTFTGNATSNANDYFEIWLTQSDISTPINSPFSLTAALGISAVSTVNAQPTFTYTAWWASNNNNFATTNQILNRSFSQLSDATSATTTGSDGGGLFSVTQRFIFSDAFGGGSGLQTSVTGTVTVQAVPVPGVLALVGVGMLGLGFMSRRRRA